MIQNLTQTSLKTKSSEPLYQQVQKSILQCLADGEWKPGAQLPTEGQLAERFGVAVFTIRGGIKELVAANILIRSQGKGTFVMRHTQQRERHQYSQIFQKDGSQIFPDREILSYARTTASGEAATILSGGKGKKPNVIQIKGVLNVDGEPASTLDVMVPLNMFKGLTSKAIREAKETLYAVYQDVSEINVIRIQERVYGAIADNRTANALKIKSSTPVLKIIRIAYTYNDIPVEFRVRYLEANQYHYRSV
jgi:GntR family transcriptional regulator